MFTGRAVQIEPLQLASCAGLGDDDMTPLTILGTLGSLGYQSLDGMFCWTTHHICTCNNAVMLVSGEFTQCLSFMKGEWVVCAVVLIGLFRKEVLSFNFISGMN